MDTRRANTWEEVTQIGANDELLSCVNLRAGETGAAAYESVGARMHRRQVKNFHENAPLQRFELRFWRFDEAWRAAGFGDEPIVVVLEDRKIRAAMLTFFIGKPIQARDWNLKPRCQVADGFDSRRMHCGERRRRRQTDVNLLPCVQPHSRGRNGVAKRRLSLHVPSRPVVSLLTSTAYSAIPKPPQPKPNNYCKYGH